MTDLNPSRAGSVLMLAGIIVSTVAGIFHPDHEMANDHHAVFAEYAQSTWWTAIHLGQFAGMAILLGGIFILARSLASTSGPQQWPARVAAVLAVASLALYGVLQAVDGVALKQAVDAWAAAPAADVPFRFATAETVRWLEWGARSYQSFVFGGTLAMLGAALTFAGRPLRWIGAPAVLAGASYAMQGWIIGTIGFDHQNSLPTLAGIAFVVITTVWLLIATVRAHYPRRIATELSA